MTTSQIRTLLFTLFMLLTGILCLVWDQREYEQPWLCLATDLGVLCAVLLLLPKGVATTVRWLLAIVLYSAALADTYCSFHFGSGLSPIMLSLMLNTNLAEVSDFLSSYGRQLMYDRRLWLLLLVMAAHAVSAGLACRLRFRWPVRWKIPAAVASLLLVAGIALTWSQKRQLATLLSQPTVSDMEGLIFRRFDYSTYLPVYRLLYACRAHQLAGRELERLRDTSASARIDSCSHRSPLIVLIIGESYNRHHSALYGYPLNTTPRQAERQRQGELTVFTDVITPWNITTNVFNHVFSLHHYGAPRPWSGYPLFPQLFRMAGYRVTFVSNQFEQHGSGSFFNQTGGFFLNDRAVSNMQFDRRNRRSRHDDQRFFEDNLPLLAGEGSPFRLDIIHLHGQHFDYESRYPRQEEVFTHRKYRGRGLTRRERKTVAHYDNATLYNDKVVDRILQFYADSTAIAVYMPDHGEEVYDDLPVHGRLYTELSARQVHQEFEIPFWVWCSKSYQEQHPDVVSLVRQAANRPFMTDRLPHLLLFLAGISCPGYDQRLNLLSPHYDASLPRTIEGIADYDALMRELKPE